MKRQTKKSDRVIQGVVPIAFLLIFMFMRLISGLTLASGAFKTSKPVAGNGTCMETDSEVGTSNNMSAESHAPFEDYSNRLKTLPELSDNLVINSDLSQIDDNDQSPVGYSRLVEGLEYGGALEYDEQGIPQLATFMNSDNRVAAGWRPEAVNVEPFQTYIYSFEYMSNAKVSVSSERIKSESVEVTGDVELNPTKIWKEYLGVFDNSQTVVADKYTITVSLTSPGELKLRNIKIYKTISSQLTDGGLVSITFDDGRSSVYNSALPVLEKYGLKTTQYVVPGKFDGDYSVQGFMSSKQIKDLSLAGHEIASHSNSHCDLTSLSLSALEEDFEKSKSALNKINPGLKSFAYPYGRYSSLTQSIAKSDYSLIRTSDAGLNTALYDRLNIRSYNIGEKTSIDEFRVLVDETVRKNNWLVLTYHNVSDNGEYSLTPETFETQMKILKESGLRVLTVSDAAKSVDDELEYKLRN